MPELFALTPAERNLLQQIINKVRRWNPEKISTPVFSIPSVVDVFLAKPHETAGIPALVPGSLDIPGSPDIPGKGYGDLYLCLPNSTGIDCLFPVDSASPAVPVYNYSSSIIEYGTWFLAIRTKHGKYVAITGGGSSLPEGTTQNDILYWDTNGTGTGAGEEGEWAILSAPATTGIFIPMVVNGILQWVAGQEFECPGTGT